MSNLQVIEKLIWHEMIHAKKWEQYISDYKGNRVSRKKYYNIATASLAVIGASTWAVWNVIGVGWGLATPIIFSIIGVTQVLSAIQNEIVIDSEKLQSLNDLRGRYISYFNKIEKLFLKVHLDLLSREEAEKAYFKLRESTIPIEALKDDLNIRELKKVNKKVEVRVLAYLERRYFDKNNENSNQKPNK